MLFFSAKCLKNFFKATENITTKEKLIDAMSKSADEKKASLLTCGIKKHQTISVLMIIIIRYTIFKGSMETGYN